MQYVILAPVFLIVLAATLFPVASSLYGLIKWRGRWQVASAIPLPAIAAAVAFLGADPRGWGVLVFIPLAMMLSAYSGVVLLVHRKRG